LPPPPPPPLFLPGCMIDARVNERGEATGRSLYIPDSRGDTDGRIYQLSPIVPSGGVIEDTKI